MLIEFTVGNYRSFKEPVTLSMVASKLVSQDQQLDENTIFEPPGGPRLLTSTVIYGANASGKSNLVAALDFVRLLVLDSARRAAGNGRHSGGTLPAGARRRLTQPSHFEIVFRTLAGPSTGTDLRPIGSGCTASGCITCRRSAKPAL